MQFVDPSLRMGESEFFTHSAHSDRPFVLPYFPFGHEEHALEPKPALNVAILHAVHGPGIAVPVYPGLQRHMVLSLLAIVRVLEFRGQFVQN